jgi:hypothetical protein
VASVAYSGQYYARTSDVPDANSELLEGDAEPSGASGDLRPYGV